MILMYIREKVMYVPPSNSTHLVGTLPRGAEDSPARISDTYGGCGARSDTRPIRSTDKLLKRKMNW